MTARAVRYHFPDGNVRVEPFTVTARRNGITLAEARDLVAEWVHRGDVVRRPDGGLDVKRRRPAIDTERIAQARARRTTTREEEPAAP